MTPSAEMLKVYLDTLVARPTLAALEARDRRSCDCPMPYTMRKYQPALGTWTNIRLCCFVRAVEKLTGETFYEHFEFEPAWEWDCNAIATEGDARGKPLGRPPDWLLTRMQAKGIPVKGL